MAQSKGWHIWGQMVNHSTQAQRAAQQEIGPQSASISCQQTDMRNADADPAETACGSCITPTCSPLLKPGWPGGGGRAPAQFRPPGKKPPRPRGNMAGGAVAAAAAAAAA